jgi:hypothetical protein
MCRAFPLAAFFSSGVCILEIRSSNLGRVSVVLLGPSREVPKQNIDIVDEASLNVSIQSLKEKGGLIP